MSVGDADGGIGIWIARESLAEDAAVASRIHTWLSDDERDRQARFAAPSPRRLDLVARGLQRRVLSRLEPGVHPGEWRFVRSATGRPSLARPFDATGLDFNLAHTRGLVVMAVSRVPRIGIDVEARDERTRMDIARRYFSDAEASAMFALPPEERPLRFLRLWTLKEAYLKATGEGVASGLAGPAFEFIDDAAVFHGPQHDTGRWMFEELQPPGYLVAMAYPELSAAARRPVTFTEVDAADF